MSRIVASPGVPMAREPSSGLPMALAGPRGGGGDHVRERHAQREELRQGDQLVVGGAVDAHNVHIARNAVGLESGFEHCFRRHEPEGACAVADVEEDATLARRNDFLAYRAVAGACRRSRVGAEAVGHHVAGAQAAHHFEAGSAGGCPGGTSPAARPRPPPRARDPAAPRPGPRSPPCPPAP